MGVWSSLARGAERDARNKKSGKGSKKGKTSGSGKKSNAWRAYTTTRRK